MAKNIEEQMVFAVSPGSGDGVPVILLGIPEKAWEYMKDGKTHTFDLTRAGLEVKLVLFGAKDHDAAMKLITDGMAERGITVIDERRKDFSIKGRKP